MAQQQQYLTNTMRLAFNQLGCHHRPGVICTEAAPQREWGNLVDLAGGASCEFSMDVVCFGNPKAGLFTLGRIASAANPKGAIQAGGKKLVKEGAEEVAESKLGRDVLGIAPSGRSPADPKPGRGPDFIVDSRGTTVPTDPARLRHGLEKSGAFTDTSTKPATSRKFEGVDHGEPIRIRVERGHPENPAYSGPKDPLHSVDHLHVERRSKGLTGKWREQWKIPFQWPW